MIGHIELTSSIVWFVIRSFLSSCCCLNKECRSVGIGGTTSYTGIQRTINYVKNKNYLWLYIQFVTTIVSMVTATHQKCRHALRQNEIFSWQWLPSFLHNP